MCAHALRGLWVLAALMAVSWSSDQIDKADGTATGNSQLVTASATRPFVVTQIGTGPHSSQRAPALCVVDDSADIVGHDGFSVSREGTFPILHYLLPSLGCGECTYWSAFRLRDSEGALPLDSLPCDVSETHKPHLTMTSPLISTIDTYVNAPMHRDVYFITNGLDWPIEGGNSNFRVEMDVGKDLANWLGSSSTREVITGVVQDNFGSRRRSNMVLGFLDVPSGIVSLECSTPVGNHPAAFDIELTHFHNPKTSVLTKDGALRIRPSVTITVGQGLRQRIFEINTDGIVEMPESFLGARPSTIRLDISFVLPAPSLQIRCWDIMAVLPGVAPIKMQCSGSGGRIDCMLPIQEVPSWLRSGGKVFFQVAPSVPEWERALPNGHSLKLTMTSLREMVTKRSPIQVARMDANPVSNLTIREILGK